MCSGERGFVYTVDGAGSVGWSYVGPRTRRGADYSGTPERLWLDDGSTGNFVQFVLTKILTGDERRGNALHNVAYCPTEDCFNTSAEVIARRGGFPEPLPESLVEGDVTVVPFDPAARTCRRGPIGSSD